MSRAVAGAFRFLLAYAWLVWLAHCTGLAQAEETSAFPAATPESQGIPAAAVRRLADEVAGYVKDGTIVGGELLIIKNRKTILHEAFGDRDRQDKLAMAPNTIFNIRSMTKPLTGVTVQMLVEEGKVRLEDPVAKYLPAFDNDKSRAITVQQLLEHRSGLPLTIITKRIDEYPDLQAQVKAIGEKGPEFPPGSRFWYSDAGSDTAAAVVEKVSGMTIDRFISERILKPLVMTDSFYPNKEEDPRKQRIASLYLGKPGSWFRGWRAGAGKPMYPFAWGSQTLYSTPVDYAKFLAMWMDGGMAQGKRLLSQAALKRILTPASLMKVLGAEALYPTSFVGLRAWYGQMSMGYAAGDKPSAAQAVAIGHGGSDGTVALAFPAEDLIVCYFTQSRGQVTTIRIESTIQDALLKIGKTPLPTEWQAYLGSYQAPVGRPSKLPFRVVARCGRLALDIPDQLVFELKEPDANGRWVFAASDKVAVSFKKDDAGAVVAVKLKQGATEIELPREKVGESTEK
jgi:CubicO group peptidase (beta-lactamase class C family)